MPLPEPMPGWEDTILTFVQSRQLLGSFAPHPRSWRSPGSSGGIWRTEEPCCARCGGRVRAISRLSNLDATIPACGECWVEVRSAEADAEEAVWNFG